MLSDLIKTAKQTTIYSFGNLSSKLIGFVLLPLYTQHLTLSEYGILAIFQATSQILIGIFGFNLHTAMLRWLSTEKDPQDQKSIIFTTVLSTILILIPVTFSLLQLSDIFSVKFFSTINYSKYFTLIILSSSFAILNKVPLNLIRHLEKPVHYIVLTTIRFTIVLILNIYLIVFKQMGIEGILISDLAGNLFLIIVTIPFVFRHMNFSFRYDIFKSLIKYGFPLIFSASFTFALSLGDRYIINFLVGEQSVGLYSLGYKFASILNVFLLQPFFLGFLPISFKKFQSKGDKRFFSKVTTYFIFALSLGALLLSLFGKEIVELLSNNSEFWNAYTVIPIICFAFVFKGIQSMFALVFHFTKKTPLNAYIIVASAAINLVLNFTLIPVYGYFGSAISLLIAFIFQSVFSYHMGKKLYPIPYELGKLVKLLLILLVLIVISAQLINFSFGINLILKLGLFVSFPFLLHLLNFYEPVELDRIKGLLIKAGNVFRLRK